MKRILVVDDDISTGELVRRILQSPDIEVMAVTDAQQTLEALKKQVFSLIVLDVIMPGVDGFQLLQQIRAEPRFGMIPIVFLTGRSEVDDRIQGMTIGADDYISKPFNRDELKLRIERILMRMDQLENPMNRELDTQNSFDGSLADFALAPLLTLLAMENKTGCLSLSIGGFHYTFNIVEGVLFNANRADKPTLTSYQCVFEALSGKGGTFHYQNGDVPTHDDFGQSTSQILLQVAQEMDESREGAKWDDDLLRG